MDGGGRREDLATPSFVNTSVIAVTDGANVAISTNVSVAHTGQLAVVPIGGGTLTSIGGGTFASIIDFDGNLLAWMEPSGTNAISQAQPKVTLSQTSCPFSTQRLASNLLAYCKFGGSYTWHGVTGVSTLKAETAAAYLFMTDGWMYLQSGGNVYRIAAS